RGNRTLSRDWSSDVCSSDLGAGLENFDPKDLDGAIYDVISIIGSLRQYHSDLLQIFAPIKNKQDTEEYEVWLEDEERREGFYDEIGRASCRKQRRTAETSDE